MREVERAHRPVDVLVNNAGTETAGHLTDLTPDELEQLVVYGVYVLPQLIDFFSHEGSPRV